MPTSAPGRLVPVLLALAALASAGAADGETVVADIRLGFGVGPMPDVQDGSIVSPAAQQDAIIIQRYEDTPGLSLSLCSMYGHLVPAGLLVGVQITSTTGEMAFESLEVNGTVDTAEEIAAIIGDLIPGMSFSQTGLALNLGAGLALSPSWHLELVGIAGVAWTTWDGIATLGGSDLTVQEGDGFGLTFGGRFGVYWTDPASSWQFGLEAEYTATETTLETSYNLITVEADIENAGAALRAVIGRRF